MVSEAIEEEIEEKPEEKREFVRIVRYATFKDVMLSEEEKKKIEEEKEFILAPLAPKSKPKIVKP